MSDLAELSTSTSSRPSGDTVSRLPKGRAAAKMLVRAGYRCSQCFARHTECLCRLKQVPFALQKLSPLSVRTGRPPLPVQVGRAAPARARSWPWLALSHEAELTPWFCRPSSLQYPLSFHASVSIMIPDCHLFQIHPTTGNCRVAGMWPLSRPSVHPWDIGGYVLSAQITVASPCATGSFLTQHPDPLRHPRGPLHPGHADTAHWGKFYKRARRQRRHASSSPREKRISWLRLHIDRQSLIRAMLAHGEAAIFYWHPWHTSQLAHLTQALLQCILVLSNQWIPRIPCRTTLTQSTADNLSSFPLEALTSRRHPPSRLGPKSQGQPLFVLSCFLRFLISQGGLVDARVGGKVTNPSGAATISFPQLPPRSAKPLVNFTIRGLLRSPIPLPMNSFPELANAPSIEHSAVRPATAAPSIEVVYTQYNRLGSTLRAAPPLIPAPSDA